MEQILENSKQSNSQNSLKENPNTNSNIHISNIYLSQKMNTQIDTPLSMRGNVKSYCRFRPNYTINSAINNFSIENNHKTLTVDFNTNPDNNKTSKKFVYRYNFNDIFSAGVKNKEIYEKVCQQNIKEMMTKHKNCLIFVYGVTNSGKTYTVNGNLGIPGILQYSLIQVVEEYEKLKKENDSWLLSCTYIEIYNEEIFDLLSKDKKKLKIGGGGNKFFPQGAIIKYIEKNKDFESILMLGENNRTKAETNSNPYSSRSHSIFRVEISYKGDISDIEPVSLCIVDLAGAERVGKSGVLGSGVKEAGNINSSLLVLKKCFDAMEVNSKTNITSKKVIVPVRESKLTMLFKEYFALNQNISVICTINPDKNEMLDNRSVLTFGSKAMKIKPMKSWIPTFISNSKEKYDSKNNGQLAKGKKKYRLFTEKKYLESHYQSNNISKEKENIRKGSEDNHESKKSSNNSNIQNIKVIKIKDLEQNIHGVNSVSPISNENSINNSNLLIEQKIKNIFHPLQLTKTLNLFIQSKCQNQNKLSIENDKEKLLKKKEQIRKLIEDLLIKKLYSQNLEHNIRTYENDCDKIDLSEAKALLLPYKSNISIKNPFIKSPEKPKPTLSKDHQVIISYINEMKPIMSEPDNNEKNFQISNNINIDFQGIKNNMNDTDVLRTNKDILEDLQVKLTNSEFEQVKIKEFLERSFEAYQVSMFKEYFGIGESLIKKESEEQNMKEKKEKIVSKFNAFDKEIEMIEKDNNNNNINQENKLDDININENNIDEFLDNNFNFKGSSKDNQKLDNKEEKNIDNDIIENDNNKEETNIEEEEEENNKKNKKKKKYQKKSKKKQKNDEKMEILDEIEDKNKKKEEKKSKSKSREKVQKYPKEKDKKIENIIDDELINLDVDGEDEDIKDKKSKKSKVKKCKKKKMDSDNDISDDSSIDDIIIKTKKHKRGKYKKKNY